MRVGLDQYVAPTRGWPAAIEALRGLQLGESFAMRYMDVHKARNALKYYASRLGVRVLTSTCGEPAFTMKVWVLGRTTVPPHRGHKRLEEMFRRLKLGESGTVPCRNVSKVRASIYYYAAKVGIKVSTRIELPISMRICRKS